MSSKGRLPAVTMMTTANFFISRIRFFKSIKIWLVSNEIYNCIINICKYIKVVSNVKLSIVCTRIKILKNQMPVLVPTLKNLHFRFA